MVDTWQILPLKISGLNIPKKLQERDSLIRAVQNWPVLATRKSGEIPPCPIDFFGCGSGRVLASRGRAKSF